MIDRIINHLDGMANASEESGNMRLAYDIDVVANTMEKVAQEPLHGYCVYIDLKECDGEILKDKDKVEEYIKQVCDLMDVKRISKPMILRFGPEGFYGYSFAQFIQTSLVSGHLNEINDSAFIDLFSCKSFDYDKAAEFTKDYYGAKKMKTTKLYRE